MLAAGVGASKVAVDDRVVEAAHMVAVVRAADAEGVWETGEALMVAMVAETAATASPQTNRLSQHGTEQKRRDG